MSEYRKPLPIPDEDSEPYWNALTEHRLVIQRCQGCGNYRFRPRYLCPNCLSENTEWVEVSGKGKVWSWIVVHQKMVQGFEDEIPYVVVVVELEDGPRMTSNLIGCKPDEVYLGMPVEAFFEDVTDQITLPKFRPSKT